MSGIVFNRPCCQECGARSSRLSAPFLCDRCLRGPCEVEPLAAGEQAWIVTVDRLPCAPSEPGTWSPATVPWPTGPIRDRALADRLAALWGGIVSEYQPAPAVYRVGADEVTV